MTDDLISIVMATYNDDVAYLKESLESIMCQTYSNWELIIVDDSTKEDTIGFLKAFSLKCEKIIYLHNQEKLGFVRSLNYGLKQARGKYIARMDSDDISLPDRLLSEKEFLDTHTDIDIVGADILIIDESGIVTGERHYDYNYNAILDSRYFRNPLAHPVVMYRADVIKQIGGYDENFQMAEDYELWLRAIRLGLKVANIPICLLKYRIPSDYYARRSKENWHYNILAKKKNKDNTLRYYMGLMVSVALYSMPSSIIRLLYEVDRKSKAGG